MKSKSHELTKQHAFNAFCKTVLRNEARNHYAEVKRLSAKEVFIEDLTITEYERLAITDEYFVYEEIFDVYGKGIIVKDEIMAASLKSLSKNKREIILMCYFIRLSDAEIGKILGLMRSTVQYQRTTALRELKRMMEGCY
jgi:RNA polymerase sigma factor (sigma-70 family)